MAYNMQRQRCGVMEWIWVYCLQGLIMQSYGVGAYCLKGHVEKVITRTDQEEGEGRERKNKVKVPWHGHDTWTSIAMDFIVKLPPSDSYDTILIVTDTFSKASIFIPCNETINAKSTARLYTTYVLPHYVLPTCIISDRDPHFTSTFSQELCCTLAITQNISTALCW